MKKGYLVIDIGTGNVRVAAVSIQGEVLYLERDTVQYHKDPLYPDALYFEPDVLWSQVEMLADKVLKECNCEILAVTSGSQREGIVLVDDNGNSLIGFPNHDHRGREWEHEIEEKDKIYRQTGRYPSSLFSAMKLLAVKRKQPALYNQVAVMMSLSDWAGFKLTGVTGYEHAQASETQLYNVADKAWSDDLCGSFFIEKKILPVLQDAGTVLGKLLPAYIDKFRLPGVPFITGGADTQLAVLSTRPQAGEIVIVSGTTTPVVKIINDYITDPHQRTWTNRHSIDGTFILETNAGVSGLNLQRLKEIFYPNESYAVMEEEVKTLTQNNCVASLGSLIAGEERINRGGFVFDVPVSHELNRADFVRAVLWDIALCIKANLDILIGISGYDKDYIWACGGGLQSRVLTQELASLTGKIIRFRKDYQHASVVGGAMLCNAALGISPGESADVESVHPSVMPHAREYITRWETVRKYFGSAQRSFE